MAVSTKPDRKETIMCDDCIYREDFGRYRCCNHDCMYYMVPTEYITDCKDYEKGKDEKDD